MLTRLAPQHRASLVSLLGTTPEFSPEEVSVALELIDDGLAERGDYRFLVEVDDAVARGYICYGPTPMTEGTFDLYWICVDRTQKQKGIGRRLIGGMEDELRALGARLVRVETEGSEGYEPTRAFYAALGYEVLATLRDFYRVGRDLVVYGHYLR